MLGSGTRVAVKSLELDVVAGAGATGLSMTDQMRTEVEVSQVSMTDQIRTEVEVLSQNAYRGGGAVATSC